MTAGIDIGPSRKRSAPQGWKAQAGRDSIERMKCYHSATLMQACIVWMREAERASLLEPGGKTRARGERSAQAIRLLKAEERTRNPHACSPSGG